MKLQSNLKISKKNVLVRVDLNLPRLGKKITDYSKIYLLKKTIKDLINRKNKIFLLSHFGRPNGKVDHNYSLKFILKELQSSLGIKKINFVNDCVGIKIKNKILKMKYGEICLMENIRFYKQEEKNDKNFCKRLSKNFDYYINDAFSASHRKHASIVGITKFLPSLCGLSFEKEILALERFLKNPKKPVMSIIGGSKVSTKLVLLKNLVKNTDYLVIGGGMANTFIASKGYDLKNSFIEHNCFRHVKIIEKNANKYGCKIILPTDFVTAKKLSNTKKVIKTNLNNIGENQMILDIGKDSCMKIKKLIPNVKTVLWNGPLGAFEYFPFNYSTEEIAKQLSLLSKQKKIKVIVGGGDTLASCKNLNVLKDFAYVSTSGGAFIEWLEGKNLPGILALKKNNLI